MEGTTKIKVPVRKKARIEIIPLIDVIFFLLATFVLFILSLDRITMIDVPLPSTNVSQKKPDPNDEPVRLQVSGDGQLFWNREPIDMNELPARIGNYKASNQDPKILLAGDEKARFGATVQVLDEIRKAGIEKFSIETTPSPTGR